MVPATTYGISRRPIIQIVAGVDVINWGDRTKAGVFSTWAVAANNCTSVFRLITCTSIPPSSTNLLRMKISYKSSTSVYVSALPDRSPTTVRCSEKSCHNVHVFITHKRLNMAAPLTTMMQCHFLETTTSEIFPGQSLCSQSFCQRSLLGDIGNGQCITK